MNKPKDVPRWGFTLIELIVIIAILGVLLALLAPSFARALDMADQTTCASNLHQLGIGLQLYLKDNDGYFFPIRENNPNLWYFGEERGSSWASTAEGNRLLDKTRAKLYPYVPDCDSLEICPAFDYDGSFKAKFRGKWWTYGINKDLSPDRYVNPSLRVRNDAEIRGRDRSRTVVLADAAQVNTFQPPASRKNPMVEEWHYVQRRLYRPTDLPHVHFRHRGRANVLFADWHVSACDPAPGTFDARLPGACIGHLNEEEVTYEPRNLVPSK
jgi:prepilin-type processing-associated H-X9-DG protein